MLLLQGLSLAACALASGHAPLACEEDCAADRQELLQSMVAVEVSNVQTVALGDLLPTPALSLSLSLSSAKNPPLETSPRYTSHSQPGWMHICIIACVLLVGAFLSMIVFAMNSDLSWMSFIISSSNSTLYGSQLTLSYDIAVQHNGGAAVSGIILAGPVLSNIIGTMLGRLLDSWHRMPRRSLMVMCTLLLGLNLVAFWGMAASSVTSLFMLILARLVEGVLVGMRGYYRFQLLEDEEASESQVGAAMLWDGIGAAFGVAMAPIMTSLGESLFTSFDFDRNSVMAAASVYFPLLIVLPCCSVIWNLKFLRKIESGADTTDANDPVVVSDMSSHSTVSRVAICAFGVCLYTLLHSALQAIEVGTSFLLEVVYGMNTRNIGLFVGVSLLGILPVAGMLGRWLGALEHSRQLQAVNMFLIVNVLASLLFIPVNLQGAPWWILILLGDITIFGTIVTVGGFLHKNVLLACKGMLKWGTFNIIFKLAFTLRSAAGPLVRLLIANSSGRHQLFYALVQVTLAVCCFVLGFVFNICLKGMTT